MDSLKLIRLFDPLGAGSGFVLPVFAGRDGRNALYIQKILEDDTVGEFTVFDQGEGQWLDWSPENEIFASVGERALWAYFSKPSFAVVGTKEKLADHFSGLTADRFADELGVAAYDTADFLQLLNPIKKSLAGAFNLLGGPGSRSAEFWRDYLVLMPKIRAKIVATLKSKGVSDGLSSEVAKKFRIISKGKTITLVPPQIDGRIADIIESEDDIFDGVTKEVGFALGIERFRLSPAEDNASDKLSSKKRDLAVSVLVSVSSKFLDRAVFALSRDASFAPALDVFDIKNLTDVEASPVYRVDSNSPIFVIVEPSETENVSRLHNILRKFPRDIARRTWIIHVLPPQTKYTSISSSAYDEWIYLLAYASEIGIRSFLISSFYSTDQSNLYWAANANRTFTRIFRQILTLTSSLDMKVDKVDYSSVIRELKWRPGAIVAVSSIVGTTGRNSIDQDALEGALSKALCPFLNSAAIEAVGTINFIKAGLMTEKMRNVPDWTLGKTQSLAFSRARNIYVASDLGRRSPSILLAISYSSRPTKQHFAALVRQPSAICQYVAALLTISKQEISYDIDEKYLVMRFGRRVRRIGCWAFGSGHPPKPPKEGFDALVVDAKHALRDVSEYYGNQIISVWIGELIKHPESFIEQLRAQ